MEACIRKKEALHEKSAMAMKSRKCYNCGKILQKKRALYQYKESGLPNLYLREVNFYHCSCGEEMVEIPCVEQLNQRIAETIIASSPHLNGPEIRFLRKQLGLKAIELARIFGVSKVTVSRWENGKVKIDKAYDRMIRALVKNAEFRAVLEQINNRKKTAPKSHRYVIDAKTMAALAI
jgi:putative transcriptional regulator